MSDWVSVQDELPKEVLVLIVTKKGVVTVGEYCEKNNVWTALDPYCLGYIDNVHFPTVTHWMPLPEAPKEEK